MSTLGGLEHEFQSFVLEGAPGVERAVVGTGRVPVETRLGIYSHAYHARLAEALTNNFPVLAKLLGDEQFSGLAGGYSRRFVSAHYSIRWYGDRLADFLATEWPYSEKPLLAELARWEWSMTLAFDAADRPPLRAASLEVLAPEQWAELRLISHPSAQHLSLRTNAAAVWRALNRDEAPPSFTDGDPQAWLIWRKGLETFFRSIDRAEALALAALAKGDTFAALCEALAQELREEQAAEEAAKLLRRWLDDELLAAS